MLNMRMPIRYNTFTSELLWLLWGLHQSDVCVVVIYLGHVLDVQEKQKECQDTRELAGFCVIYAVETDCGSGIIENNSACPVCIRFYTADRNMIRKIVIGLSLSPDTSTTITKQSLCVKHRHIGYSARSQTVGEAGNHFGHDGGSIEGSLATDRSGDIPVLLPTLSDFGVRHRSHHEYNVRRLKRQKLRRRRSKRF